MKELSENSVLTKDFDGSYRIATRFYYSDGAYRNIHFIYFNEDGSLDVGDTTLETSEDRASYQQAINFAVALTEDSQQRQIFFKLTDVVGEV